MILSCPAPCTCHIPSGDPFCVKPAAAQILCSGISANAFRSHLGWIWDIGSNTHKRQRHIHKYISQMISPINIPPYTSWIPHQYLKDNPNQYPTIHFDWVVYTTIYLCLSCLSRFIVDTPATPISGTSLPMLSPHHSVGHWDAAGVPVPKGCLKKQPIKVMCCYPPGN